jgi:hypothetical protein
MGNLTSENKESRLEILDMSENDYLDTLSRRELLKIIAGSAGSVISFPILSNAAPHDSAHLNHMEPPVVNLAAYTPKLFNTHQLETIATLSEIIIPTDKHSPGARAAGVHEYIDDLIADSEESQKALWMQGLAAVDKMTELQHGKQFVVCPAEQQVALIEEISKNEEKPTRLEEQFFVAIKKATVDGYYTSEIGIHKEIEYQGNTVVLDFKGCTHEEHKTGL